MIGRWFRRLLSPSRVSVQYEVTARCNLDCAHCYNVWKGGDSYSREELPIALALKVVRKAAQQSRCSHFAFTGGEPTLRPDLEDLVCAAASYSQSVSLITNGMLLTKERTKALLTLGVSLFELPLNAADRSMHNRMAGGVDCFDHVTRAATEIRGSGGNLVFVFVATTLNIDHWEEALQLGIALALKVSC